ncbi:MAG: ABC-2 type transport system permease protein [Haloarculaceae archaeon]|jgi:ABC-2 type transport system permease protein
MASSPSQEAGQSEAPATRSSDYGPESRTVVPSPQKSLEFVRVELLKGYRWVRDQDFWIAFMLVVGGIYLFLGWLTFDAARDVGSTLAQGASPPAWLFTATGVFWLFLTVLTVFDSVGSNGSLDNDGHYLTIRPIPDIVGGKLIAAASKFSAYTLSLGLAAGAGLAAGIGSPLPVIGMLAAAVVIAVTATAIGYPIGLAFKGFLRRSPRLARSTTAVGLGLVYLTLSVPGGLLGVVEQLEPVFQAPPIAWLGDLALLTTAGADVNSTGALVVLGLTALVSVGGLLLSVTAARYAWVADAAHASDGEETERPTAPDHAVDTVLGLVCQAPSTRGIASTTLLRAVRSPLQFVFVAPPMVAAISFIDTFVTSGTVPWFVPWFVVGYGAWAAGAVLPLNPHGNQGSMLSTLLTAPTGPRAVVHGNVVAAALLGGPVTAGLAVGAGFIAGNSPMVLATLGVVSIPAVVGGAVVATGLGSVYPRFDAVSFSGSKQAVPPSKRAYSLFSVYVSLTVVSASVVSNETAREVGSLLLSRWLPWGLDIGAEMLVVASAVVLVGSVVSIPLAYRTAIRRVEACRYQGGNDVYHDRSDAFGKRTFITN